MKVSATAAIIGVIFAVTTPHAGVAQTTSFTFTPIVVAGSSAVNAVGINNRDMIIGTYDDGTADHGFVLTGAVATMLPPPIGNCAIPCPAIPKAINTSGDVLVTAGSGSAPLFLSSMFLWHDGAYSLEDYVGGLPIGLNASGEAFDGLYLNGTEDRVGRSGVFSDVRPPGEYPVINSINSTGKVSGTTGWLGTPPFGPQVFVSLRKGGYKLIVPPGYMVSYGGFVNNSGEVAGTYQDAASVWHGFVYRKNSYKLFDLPGTPVDVPYTPSVMALNDKGRVVGVFTDGSDPSNLVQHAFLYNGSEVSVFGSYTSDQRVTVKLNDPGLMVVSVHSYTTNLDTSFRVKCSGAAC